MKKIIAILSVLFVLLVAVQAFSQMPVPVGPGDGDGTETPIGGLVVLAGLGGAYAVKKLRDGRREK